MKICVFGIGAIGGILATALSRGGAEVSLLARGQTLAALQTRGLRVCENAAGDTVEVPALRLSASDDPATLGRQDVVVLALKAQQIETALPQIEPLLGSNSVVVSAQNGIPWWYFHGAAGAPGLPPALAGRNLKSVDPSGTIASRLPAERTVGCVLYLAAELAAPGLVRRTPGGRILLGPATETQTPFGTHGAARRLVDCLNAGGETATLQEDIRAAIWEKLWGNVAFNPLSALTAATLAEIARDPKLRALTRDVMLETEAVARELGLSFSLDVEARIDRAGSVGEHRSSMLQDLDAGRPPETGALMTAVSEIGEQLGVQTPFLDAITALVEARARHYR